MSGRRLETGDGSPVGVTQTRAVGDVGMTTRGTLRPRAHESLAREGQSVCDETEGQGNTPVSDMFTRVSM